MIPLVRIAGGELDRLFPAQTESALQLEARSATGDADGLAAEVPVDLKPFLGIFVAALGLHGVLVLIGIVVLALLMGQAAQGQIGPENMAPLERAGVYWHSLCMIWMFLFPLLYLID